METIVPLASGTVNFADVPNIPAKYMERMMSRVAQYMELHDQIKAEEESSMPPSSSVPTPAPSMGNDPDMLKAFVDAEFKDMAQKQLDVWERGQQAAETPTCFKILAPKEEQN